MPSIARKIVCFSGTQAPAVERKLWVPVDLCFCFYHENDGTADWLLICDIPDFDGTIFMQDTGHILFDNLGCGTKRRQMLDEQIKTGERSFRDVSEEMWGSLRVPFEDGFEVMEKELEIDPGFREFHEFCIANDIDFNVISAGLKPILRRVLDTFLGEQAVSRSQLPIIG
jgi:2-hydroxy-3-keto-5-methylthiopentenyl-1-phosphate phosphatase